MGQTEDLDLDWSERVVLDKQRGQEQDDDPMPSTLSLSLSHILLHLPSPSSHQALPLPMQQRLLVNQARSVMSCGLRAA